MSGKFDPMSAYFKNSINFRAIKYKKRSTSHLKIYSNNSIILISNSIQWASNQSFIKHWKRSKVMLKHSTWHPWSTSYKNIPKPLHDDPNKTSSWYVRFNYKNFVLDLAFLSKAKHLATISISITISISSLIPKLGFDLRQTPIHNIFPLYMCAWNRLKSYTQGFWQSWQWWTSSPFNGDKFKGLGWNYTTNPKKLGQTSRNKFKTSSFF